MCHISVFLSSLSIPVLPSLIYSPHRPVKVFDLGLFPVLRLCAPHHLFLAVWLAEREFKKMNLTKIIFQQFYLLVLRTLGRYNHLTGELALQVLCKSQIGVSYQELLHTSSRLLSVIFKIFEIVARLTKSNIVSKGNAKTLLLFEAFLCLAYFCLFVCLSIPVLPSLVYSPLRCVKVFDLDLFRFLLLCGPHHLFLAVWMAE